ncbi:MAG: hypothetical protein ACFE8A_10460 [Candidatus Hodarchaeota archaeon]
MAIKDKIKILILVSEDPENTCSKCCRTLSIVERLVTEFSDIKDKVNLKQEKITSEKVIEKYGELDPPVIFLNDFLFSQGHVPVMKKLGRKILELIK